MKAFILAAGFGSRMVPLTYETPKPLVSVNGVSFIETIIEAFLSKGISDIYVVRGYKKECFDRLLENYPFLRFIDNDDYDKGNNILSFEKMASEFPQGGYIAEADLFVNNPDVIEVNPMSSYYLGTPVEKTDDWCFQEENRKATNYQKGGEHCFQACGLSYWTPEDAKMLISDLSELLKNPQGKDYFWEFIPLVLFKEHYSVRIKPFHLGDITEIDTIEELAEFDLSYKQYVC